MTYIGSRYRSFVCVGRAILECKVDLFAVAGHSYCATEVAKVGVVLQHQVDPSREAHGEGGKVSSPSPWRLREGEKSCNRMSRGGLGPQDTRYGHHSSVTGGTHRPARRVQNDLIVT